MDFTATFFAKHSLLNVLTRFCVFTAEKELLVMRPYQIAATEKILQRILIATYDKKKLCARTRLPLRRRSSSAF